MREWNRSDGHDGGQDHIRNNAGSCQESEVHTADCHSYEGAGRNGDSQGVGRMVFHDARRIFLGREVPGRRWPGILKAAVKRTFMAVAIALIVLLLPWELCFAASVRAVEPGALEMVAANIPGAKQEAGTLELSLKVKGGSAFQTAAILVEYDYSKIRPIGWDREQTPAVIPDLTGVLDAAAWNEAAILETKSPGHIAGKPALSFRRGNRAYLYMAAESARGEVLQEDTLVAAARFCYADGAVPSKDFVASAVNFAEDREGKKAACASPVKGSVLYGNGGGTDGEPSFCYYMPLEKTASGTVRENLNIPSAQLIDDGISRFTYIAEGRSVSAKPAEPKDFVSLAFYDWDGMLLGTRIVAKGTGALVDPNTPENRHQYINEDGTARFTDDELAAMGAAPLVPEGNLLTGGADSSGSQIAAVNKAGYTFAGWVDYGESSTPNVGITDRNLYKIAPEALVPLSGLTESQALRAAYDETGISTGSNSERRYNIYYSPFRYDAAKQFLEVTLTAVRGEGARRINGNTVLVVSLRPKGAGETRLKIKLKQTDVESYVLQMPTGAVGTYSVQNAISCTVWDEEGVNRGAGITIPADWITADRKSGGI